MLQASTAEWAGETSLRRWHLMWNPCQLYKGWDECFRGRLLQVQRPWGGFEEWTELVFESIMMPGQGLGDCWISFDLSLTHDNRRRHARDFKSLESGANTQTGRHKRSRPRGWEDAEMGLGRTESEVQQTLLTFQGVCLKTPSVYLKPRIVPNPTWPEILWVFPDHYNKANIAVKQFK